MCTSTASNSAFIRWKYSVDVSRVIIWNNYRADTFGIGDPLSPWFPSHIPARPCIAPVTVQVVVRQCCLIGKPCSCKCKGSLTVGERTTEVARAVGKTVGGKLICGRDRCPRSRCAKHVIRP